MSKSSSSSTQQVTTTQQTNVQVTNVIEAPKQTPLEKLKMLADVLQVIEPSGETGGAGTAVILTSQDSLAWFKDPNNLIMLSAGIIGIILIAKKV